MFSSYWVQTVILALASKYLTLPSDRALMVTTLYTFQAYNHESSLILIVVIFLCNILLYDIKDGKNLQERKKKKT